MSSTGELFIIEVVTDSMEKSVKKKLIKLWDKNKHIQDLWIRVPSKFYDMELPKDIESGRAPLMISTIWDKEIRIGTVSWKVSHFVDKDSFGNRYVNYKLEKVKTTLNKNKLKKLME